MGYDLIVVGGGAAGLFAAARAGERGAATLLLEQNDRLGRKLRITGKGRCNLTNDCSNEEFLQNVPTNPKFLHSAICAFSTADAKACFEALGVPLKTERGNRVFPVSDRASDVADALAAAAKRAGVHLETGRATEILRRDDRAVGIRCGDGREYYGTRILLATGGLSYPQTGSDGSGYRMAAACGHTIREPGPSLAPLVSSDEACADLQGLSLRNVTLSLCDAKAKRPAFRELGELLFTNYGMSGPLVLSASAHIRPFEPGRWSVRLDLKPGLSEEQLDDRVLRDFAEFSNRAFANSLEKLLPRKLIPVVVMRSGLPPLQKVREVTRAQRRSLVSLLKSFSIPVDGFRPVEEAIVTTGGVSVREVDPRTMESKLLPGLYFAGELLDVDGYTGGFNLQIAWSTAELAAQGGRLG